MKYKVAILKNESERDHLLWLKACQNSKLIEADVIDITENNWLLEVQKKKYDLYLLKAPGQTSLFKQLFDERIWILNQVLNRTIYPSLNEIYIYENKRLLRDWLVAKQFPHPKSEVFFHKAEAQKWVNKYQNFPLVAKTNIGASGNGVVFLNDCSETTQYIEVAFSTGIKSKSGPKLFKGTILKKIKKVLKNRQFLKNRIKEYKVGASEAQKNFVILQEFVPHSFEWRCVKIGNSYFAHKKIAKGGKTSGTLIKGYDPVPESLLNFIKVVSQKGNLSSVAIDIFENENNYLINEIQCFFGQSDPYQMLVGGKPGRYVEQAGKWVFEEGMFNTNECYDLRLNHALSLLS